MPTAAPPDFTFADGLRELIDGRCGLPVAGIYFLDRALVLAGAAVTLPIVGLPAGALIEFRVMDRAGYPERGSVLRGAKSFAAFTAAVRKEDGGVAHHVFVQATLTDPDELAPWDRDKALAGHQLIALAHELGHVRDAVRGINFRFDPPQVWLARAEAEAHAFALQHLVRWPWVRDQLASTLLCKLRGATTPHEQALFAALIARVGRKKLETWAGNSLPASGASAA